MVKITNVFGDEYKGRQGNAVYQKKYGKQIRRVWDGKKRNTAPAQEEQKARFRQAHAWIKQLTSEEVEGLKTFVNRVRPDLTWQQYAIKTALDRGKVSITTREVSTIKEILTEGWHAEGWPYRQKITLTNNNAYDLIDYQIKLDLDSTKVGDNFDWSKQGADLRFYDSNGNKLSYWVESWDEVNKQAVVWVKVGLISAGSTTDIYMYYGNSEAVSESDIHAKYFIYEDMQTPPKGTLKGSAYYDSENKRLVLTEAVNSEWGTLEYEDDFNSYVIEFSSYAGGGSGADAIYCYVGATETATNEDAYINGFIFANDEYQDDLQIRYNDVMHKIDTEEVSGKLLHTTVKVIKKNDGTYLCEISNELGTLSETRTEIPQGTFLGIGARTGGKNNWHIVYYFRVMKAAEVEPTPSFGTEEREKITVGVVQVRTTVAISHSGLEAVEVYDDQNNLLIRADGLSNIKESEITQMWEWHIDKDTAQAIGKVVYWSISGVRNEWSAGGT